MFLLAALLQRQQREIESGESVQRVAVGAAIQQPMIAHPTLQIDGNVEVATSTGRRAFRARHCHTARRETPGVHEAQQRYEAGLGLAGGDPVHAQSDLGGAVGGTANTHLSRFDRIVGDGFSGGLAGCALWHSRREIGLE